MRFNSQTGVLFHVLECWGLEPWQLKEEVAFRSTAALYNISALLPCVRFSLQSATPRPTTLLRWDLPVALWWQARHIAGDRPDLAFRSPVYSHIGWVFAGALPMERRGAALANDGFSRKVNRFRACSPKQRSPRVYAEKRLALVERARWADDSPLAIGLTRNFSCRQGETQWERALEQQRAYVQLVASRNDLQSGLPPRAAVPDFTLAPGGTLQQCFGLSALYNQMHLRWGPSRRLTGWTHSPTGSCNFLRPHECVCIACANRCVRHQRDLLHE